MEAWLPEFKTEDQKNEWAGRKKYYYLLSMAWRARHTGQNDPLEALVQNKVIEPNDYDEIWLEVDLLQQLWAVVQLSYRYVKVELRKEGLTGFFFDSAMELFFFLLTDSSYSQLLPCLQPYYEGSTSKFKKLCQLHIKSCQETLTPVEELRRQKLKSKLQPDPQPDCTTLVVGIARAKAAKGNAALKAKLEDYDKAIDRLASHKLNLLYKRPSVGWKNGRRLVSRRGGSYSDS